MIISEKGQVAERQASCQVSVALPAKSKHIRVRRVQQTLFVVVISRGRFPSTPFGETPELARLSPKGLSSGRGESVYVSLVITALIHARAAQMRQDPPSIANQQAYRNPRNPT